MKQEELESLKHWITLFIDELKVKKEKMHDMRDFDPAIRSPFTLINILKQIGWEKYGSIEPTGWEGDTEITLSNENYDFDLIVHYTGYYGDLDLYRADIDD